MVMDESHTLAAIHYVECNPVVAGLSQLPEGWPWSSARAHLGEDAGIVSRVLPREWMGDWWSLRAADGEAEQRSALRRHTRTGRPLGTPEFFNKIELITGSSLALGKRGRPRKNEENVLSE